MLLVQCRLLTCFVMPSSSSGTRLQGIMGSCFPRAPFWTSFDDAATKIPAGASNTMQMDVGIGQDKKSNLKELRYALSILKSLSQVFQVRRLESVLIFFILNHPCSFMVYYYLFDVFLS